MRQGGEPQGVQVVRQGEPTPYHCNFNPLYFGFGIQKSSLHIDIHVQAAFLNGIYISATAKACIYSVSSLRLK